MNIQEQIQKSEEDFENIRCFMCRYAFDSEHSIKECPRYTYQDIKSWHKSSIKSILEGLISELKEKELTYEPNLSYRDPDFRITQEVYENCLQDTISHLQSLIKSLDATH